MSGIRITAGKVALEAELNDSATARQIWEALPISSSVATWGEEVYFDCGVSCAEEDGARTVVTAGEIAYWPPGKALCVFFGPTPASRGEEIRAASKVNVFGKVTGDIIRHFLRAATDVRSWKSRISEKVASELI